MIDVTQVTRVIRSVGEQTHNYTRAAGRVLRTRTVSRRSALVLTSLLVIVTMSGVAAAQGGGLISTAVCGTELELIVEAAFTALILGLVFTGVFFLGNGFRKMSSGGSTQVQKGRTQSLYSGVAFVGAILVSNANALLSQLGLTVLDCISFAGL